MADELIDIYDSNMNLLGTAMKSQAHREGLWHMAFHCWIVKPNKNGKHLIWLQLRGKDKELYPNLLDISVAGHLSAGEKPKDGIREAEEEIGLKINKDELVKLFTYTLAEDACGIINREFSPTYLFKTDAKIESLKMQPEEVDGVYEANIDDLIDLFNKSKKEIHISGLYRNENNSYKKEEKNIRLEDIVPHDSKYYIKVFEAAKRYCDGNTK